MAQMAYPPGVSGDHRYVLLQIELCHDVKQSVRRSAVLQMVMALVISGFICGVLNNDPLC